MDMMGELFFIILSNVAVLTVLELTRGQRTLTRG